MTLTTQMHFCCPDGSPPLDLTSSTASAALLSGDSTLAEVNVNAVDVFQPMGHSPVPADICLVGLDDVLVDEFDTPHTQSTLMMFHVMQLIHVIGTTMALMMCAHQLTQVQWSHAEDSNMPCTATQPIPNFDCAQFAQKPLLTSTNLQSLTVMAAFDAALLMDEAVVTSTRAVTLSSAAHFSAQPA